MFLILNLFRKKKRVMSEEKTTETKQATHISVRKGEIGEHKIDIQLSQFPNSYKFLNDIMIENPKSISGYSQIDHIIITPYGIFVVETKNYQGTIYGGKERKTWLVNGKFKMMNPLVQNFGHIQAIKQLINHEGEHTFISLITFTKRCTLKIGEDIRHISSDEMVIYDFYLTETINRKISIAKHQNDTPIYSDKDVENIHKAIFGANITDPVKRQEHNQSIHEAIKDKSKNVNKFGQATRCVICNKSVSNKVERYCLQNKKRFNGKVYCYEHQQSM